MTERKTVKRFHCRCPKGNVYIYEELAERPDLMRSYYLWKDRRSQEVGELKLIYAEDVEVER